MKKRLTIFRPLLAKVAMLIFVMPWADAMQQSLVPSSPEIEDNQTEEYPTPNDRLKYALYYFLAAGDEPLDTDALTTENFHILIGLCMKSYLRLDEAQTLAKTLYKWAATHDLNPQILRVAIKFFGPYDFAHLLQKTINSMLYTALRMDEPN